MSQTAAPPVRPVRFSWLGLAAAVLVVVIALVTGVVWHVKVKAVVAGAVTFSYDPRTSQISVSADPLQLVSKWVTVKIGDEIPIVGADANHVLVVIDTAASRSAFEVPDGGSWRVEAETVAGGQIGVAYAAESRQFHVDLTRVYVRGLQLERDDGRDHWSTSPSISKTYPTHPLTVDTSRLTTGDFTYCKQADGTGNCAIYLHAIANLAASQRVLAPTGDPLSVPNGARVEALCEAGGASVRNDLGESSTKWEYVVYKGFVGYLPAIWTGSARSPVVRVCGAN